MVYNNILEGLSKLGGIKDWISIHIKIDMPNDKRHEIFFSNVDYVSVVEKPVVSESVEPVVVETLEEKVKRMWFTLGSVLTPQENDWVKERQRELEYQKIGQIVPEDSMEIALEKLAKVGVKS